MEQKDQNGKLSLDEQAILAAFSFFEKHQNIALAVGVTDEVLSLKNKSEQEIQSMSLRDKERLSDAMIRINRFAEKIKEVGIEEFNNLKSEKKERILAEVIGDCKSRDYASIRSSFDGMHQMTI